MQQIQQIYTVGKTTPACDSANAWCLSIVSGEMDVVWSPWLIVIGELYHRLFKW